MADNFQRFYNGAGFRPQASDPTNPTDGDIFFSNGTPRSKGFHKWQDSQWQVLGGSGGGGLDVFFKEDHEVNGIGNYTTGNDAVVDNGGTLDGTLALETSAPIAGSQSLKYTMGSSSTNDFILGESVALDEKQQNKQIAFTQYFKYDGADADIKAFLYDVTNSEIIPGTEVNLTAEANSKRLTIQAYIKSSINNVKMGYQVLVGNSGKILLVDDIEATTNPLVFQEIYQTSEWEPETNITFEGLGTVSQLDAWKKREGDSIRIRGTVLAGTVTAASLAVVLGSEHVIDDAKLPDTAVSTALVGRAIAIPSGNQAATHIVNYFYDGSTTNKVFGSISGTSGTSFTKTLANAIIASNKALTFDFTIPIVNFDTTIDALVSSTNTSQLTAFTPVFTGFGTVANIDCKFYKTLHGTYMIFASFDTGTTTAVEAQMTLPLGASVRTGEPIRIAGHGNASATGAEGYEVLATGGDAFLNFGIGALGVSGLTPANGSTFAGAGVTVTFVAEVPIEGAEVGNAVQVISPLIRTAYVKDVKATNVPGGSSSGAAWTVRELNTITGDSSFISLASNQFTLEKGKYEIEVSSPFKGADWASIRLRDITNSVDIEYSSTVSTGGAVNSIPCLLQTEVDINSSNVYEIQYYVNGTAGSTSALGTPHNNGTSNIYTQVKITKIR